MKKSGKQSGAWAVIFCKKTNSFLLAKRSSKVNNGGLWNFFGGKVDKGELPRKALMRELGEEAGITIKSSHLAKLHSTIHRSSSRSSSRQLHYFAMESEREFSPRLNREHSDYAWFKAKNLPERCNLPTVLAIRKGLLHKAART